jgi:hypothetical protein
MYESSIGRVKIKEYDLNRYKLLVSSTIRVLPSWLALGSITFVGLVIRWDTTSRTSSVGFVLASKAPNQHS